jgi:hypothetical protein
MSGGAGHIADMIARIRDNEEMRKSRKYRKAKQNYHKILQKTDINYHDASPEELEVIRKKIKKQHTIDDWKFVFKLLLSLITTIAIFWGLYILTYKIND